MAKVKLTTIHKLLGLLVIGSSIFDNKKLDKVVQTASSISTLISALEAQLKSDAAPIAKSLQKGVDP